MILARLIPKHSKKYENFNKHISVYAELIEKYNVITLFSVWIITASGFSYLLGQIDRYSYWDWSQYSDKRVLIKGCSEVPIPTWAYLIITAELAQFVKRIYFGELRSAVKIFIKE